jgi:hypothetical protein
VSFLEEASTSTSATVGIARFSASASASVEFNAFAHGEIDITGNSIKITGYTGAVFEASVKAGGGIEIGDLSIYSAVELSAIAEVLASGELSAGPDGLLISGEVYAQVAATVEQTVWTQYQTAKFGGGMEAKVFAEAGADGTLQLDNKGVTGEAGLYAGAGVGFDGEGTVGLAGVDATLGAAVSIGLQVGFEAGAHVTYDEGIISLGLTGELSLLLGVQFDFTITIDVNQLLDSINDVGDFITQDVRNYLETKAAAFMLDPIATFYSIGNDIASGVVSVATDVYNWFAAW